jgi:diacylglycerol kinase family enzyme
MRAAVILGIGCSAKDLRPFQVDTSVEWRMGAPRSEEEADVILLFGGDGTMHRHLRRLVELGLPVLIVPSGSGNDFARALGLHGVRDSLRAWREFCTGREKVRAIDLGVISKPGEELGGAASVDDQGLAAAGELPRYFCSVAGMGLDGEVTRRANRMPRWLRGHGGYAWMAVATTFQFAPLPMKISARDPQGDWRVRSEQPTILAAFANTGIYGGGMKIAPRAKMDDGLLDVCVIGGMDAFRLAWRFPKVYFGGHLKIRGVEYFQAERGRVETEHPLEVYADGELVCRTPVEIGVRRGALKVVRGVNHTG